MVVIHQVSPIFVNFSIPEQHLGHIRRLSAKTRLPVRATLQDDPGRAASGYLTVIDNAVDSTTGTIKLKATFPNADGLLWPGQFVNAAITLETIANATVVPSEAVQSSQQGQFIYVVKSDGTVDPRPVTPGRAFGQKIIIDEGIRPGDSIVVDGQLRLFPGARIRPVEASKIDSEKL
jgi:multidrug efflux system membrane fusion protein